MNLFSYFSFTAAFFYLFIGIYALLQDYRGFVNRLFFFLTIIFSLWALANSIAIAAESKETAYSTYRFFSWVFFLFPAPLLHFSLRICRFHAAMKSRYIALLYLPGLVLYLLSHTGFDIISSFHATGYGWTLEYNRRTPLYYLNILHYSVYLFTSILLYIHWFRRSTSNREKKQASIILLTFGIGLFLSMLFGTILPLLQQTVFPPLAPVFMTIWIFGIGYAILKYRLLYPGLDIAAPTILQHIYDTVLLCDREGLVLYGNKMLMDLSGYHTTEISRLKFMDLFPEASSAQLLTVQNQSSIDTYLYARDSQEIPVQLSVSKLKDSHDDEVGFVCTAHDQRPFQNLKAEKEMHRSTAAALRASEEKFMKAFYLSPIGMAILNPETQHIEEMNDNGRVMFQIPENSHMENTHPFLRWANSSQRNYFFSLLSQTGRIETFSASFIRYDNSQLEVLVSADQIVSGGLPHLMFYFFDITQLNKLETDLINLQKFETVALMAGGIAHDFNNLLTSIRGNINLSKHYLQGDSEPLEMLSSAEGACNRAVELTSKLLSFSKYSRPHKQPVDILAIIQESLELSDPANKLETSLQADTPLLTAKGDEVQLLQVFNNLFINAKQAMNEEGTIRISVRNYSNINSYSPRRQRVQTLPLGKYIMITIRDNGTGIPPEQIQFLFDPYFTTKEQGTGLGLTVVYSIVKKHGGEVQVDSTQGEGTTFTIYLPAGDESPS